MVQAVGRIKSRLAINGGLPEVEDDEAGAVFFLTDKRCEPPENQEAQSSAGADAAVIPGLARRQHVPA